MERLTCNEIRYAAICEYVNSVLKGLMEKGEHDRCLCLYPCFNLMINTFVSPLDVSETKECDKGLRRLNVFCDALSIPIFQSWGNYDMFVESLISSFLQDKNYYTVEGADGVCFYFEESDSYK